MDQDLFHAVRHLSQRLQNTLFTPTGAIDEEDKEIENLSSPIISESPRPTLFAQVSESVDSYTQESQFQSNDNFARLYGLDMTHGSLDFSEMKISNERKGVEPHPTHAIIVSQRNHAERLLAAMMILHREVFSLFTPPLFHFSSFFFSSTYPSLSALSTSYIIYSFYYYYFYIYKFIL